MFLPDPQRRGEIDFRLATSLPYEKRLLLAGALLLGGFLLQILVHIGLGAALLLAASLLLVVKGFDARPTTEGGKAEWRAADMEQVRNILTISRKAKRWDQSVLDITCVPGFFTMAGVVGGVVVVAISLFDANHDWLAHAWITDCAVLLLPHWITGVRRILTNAPLVIKVEQLLAVARYWNTCKDEGEVMSPQIRVRMRGKEELPCDVKLILNAPELGERFLGLQIQVVLNNVQGTDYPYLYCVLVGRAELGLIKKVKPPARKNIVVERKRQEGDVHVIIFRQKTTKNSGYHTKSRQSAEIFRLALWELRKLINETRQD